MNRLILCRIEVLLRTHTVIRVQGNILDPDFPEKNSFSGWIRIEDCAVSDVASGTWSPVRGDKVQCLIRESAMRYYGFLQQASGK